MMAELGRLNIVIGHASHMLCCASILFSNVVDHSALVNIPC